MARPRRSSTAAAKASAQPIHAAPTLNTGNVRRRLTARPDSVDFRDQMYVPALVEVPPEKPIADYRLLGIPVLDQGSEGACTGFGLATLAHYLLATRISRPDQNQVSPYMAYSLARRYDEWAGEDYEGSSCRGAMKGWHKHGICALQLWPQSSTTDSGLSDQVSADAASRPLGAYFRVNHTDFVAMHAAITEVGVLYASARVHEGWQEVGPDGRIHPSETLIGGHAFAIVAYDADGFWIQNSWGPSWGDGGFCHLRYDDWLANGTDVWAARLGAPVSMPTPGATAAGAVGAVGSNAFQYNQIRPHVISLRNDGQLDAHGNIGTTPELVREIINKDFIRITDGWERRRLVLYAHGGLVAENAALQRVGEFREEMIPKECYPLSFIWKSDYWSTLRNILEEATRHRRSEGWIDAAKDFMLDRLDDALEPLARHLTGKVQWDEMKENAALATTSDLGGARLLAAQLVPLIEQYPNIDLHLVGHSAGSILHAHLVRHLTEELGLTVASCTLWAPACTTALFDTTYHPALKSGRLKSLYLYTLSDVAEQSDNCARIYNKSLLYLVSHAFEANVRVPLVGPQGEPLLGMEKWINDRPDLAKLFNGTHPGVSWIRSPNDEPLNSPSAARASSHGDFDNRRFHVLSSTLARIQGVPDASIVAQRFPRTAASRAARRGLLNTL